MDIEVRISQYHKKYSQPLPYNTHNNLQAPRISDQSAPVAGWYASKTLINIESSPDLQS